MPVDKRGVSGGILARTFYLDQARTGLRMPIGTDLVLHEHGDAEAIRCDAVALGRVVEQAARRYQTPLAFPLMDLTLEKTDLLTFLGVPSVEVDAWHFAEPPSESAVSETVTAPHRPFVERITAHHGAVRYIAERTDLIPVGMVIGPFSLMTKLVADPIIPVAIAGSGVTAEEDAGVCTVERCLALAEATVARSVCAQMASGARAVIVCEPAANSVYLSPRQMRAASAIFERFVLGPNRRIKALLENRGVDLIFHDCGQLTREMVRDFAHELHPAMLSLGSSRTLWEDAQVVPANVVLYGNLPTRLFYSDAAMPVEEVRRLTLDLIRRMAECGHAHITGSECDVLHVPGASETIRAKVDAMLTVV
jgi:uroporphyrinogen-III decarboxylase